MEQYGPIVESLGIQRLYSYTGGSVYVVRPFKKNSTNLGIRDSILATGMNDKHLTNSKESNTGKDRDTGNRNER